MDPMDFKDCVSKGELNNIVKWQNQALNDVVTRLNDMRASIANLVTRVNDLELRDPREADAPDGIK